MQTEMLGASGAVADARKFLKNNWLAIFCVSALVVVPCLWHRHIEAGDLGSHVYNAWLAQLIGKGLAPGLYIARQWSNVLFDVGLVHAANLVGFALAEKLVVSLSVLVFFWGGFALAVRVSGRAPWVLAPCFAMLAYGYSFQMGFLNYYLSIGLGCWCVALAWDLEWKGRAPDWVGVVVAGGLAYVAHPLGFLWAVATIGYLRVRRWLPEWWKMALPAAVIAAFGVVRWYLQHAVTFTVDWYSGLPVWQQNGADQLIVYGDRYGTLAWIAATFGAVCVGALLIVRGRETAWWKEMALPAELYLVAFVVTATLPENLRVSLYAAWIGLLVSRLTTISAILGLCVLAKAGLRWWLGVGFTGVAVVYFVFLFQDTGAVNRLEAHAEALVATLPVGARLVPTIAADPNWRAEFIGHAAERACVGRCFVYSNYEPSSGQFRVRVAKRGSWISEASSENAEDMQGGGYDLEAGDLPLKHLYQCDRGDWTKLCLGDLREGESTGKGWVRPE